MPDDLSSLNNIPTLIYSFLVNNWEGFAAGLSILINALLWRSQERFKKQLQSELQAEHQKFTLGAASHMATKVFDKQSEFVEQYLSFTLKLLTSYDSRNPNSLKEILLNDLKELRKIRFNYAAWISTDTHKALFKFESILNNAGKTLMVYPEEPNPFIEVEEKIQKTRNDKWKELHDIIITFFEPYDRSETEYPEARIHFVHQKLRELLSVEDLIQLRMKIVERAIEANKEKL